MAKKSEVNTICKKCNGSHFYVEYCQGNQSYKLLCADCKRNHGEGTYVKFIGSVGLSELTKLGRIEEEPSDMRQYISDAVANTDRRTNADNIGLQSDCPFDCDDTAHHPAPSEGITNNPQTLSVQEHLNMHSGFVAPVATPVIPDCPLCKQHMAMQSVESQGVKMLMIITRGSELTLQNANTGDITARFRISHCPHCGGELK